MWRKNQNKAYVNSDWFKFPIITFAGEIPGFLTIKFPDSPLLQAAIVYTWMLPNSPTLYTTTFSRYTIHVLYGALYLLLCVARIFSNKISFVKLGDQYFQFSERGAADVRTNIFDSVLMYCDKKKDSIGYFRVSTNFTRLKELFW